MRRASGEGSVFRRTLPNGKVQHIAQTASPECRWFTSTKSQGDAIRKRDEYLRKRGKMSRSHERQPLAEYLAGWLSSRALRIRPRTAHRDAKLLEAHVPPEVKQVPLSRLKPAHIQEVIDTAAKTLAPSTVALIRSLLGQALCMAVRWRLIGANPVDETDPPKIGKSKVRPLTPDELAALIARIRGGRWEALVLLYALMGPRRGEALALQWDDIDLEAGTVTFRRTLHRHDGQLMVGEVKTPASHRTVRMPRVLIAALRALQAEAGGADTLVFRTAHGTPLEPRNVYRKIKGLTGKSVHALRHTAATMLLSRKQPVQAVAAVLGHADPSITFRTYSHLVPQMLQDAADSMDEIAGYDDEES